MDDDFTYVATWRGFVHVAFVVDTCARRLVGWRVSGNATASFVLDAPEQAIHDRRPAKGAGLVAHSDRGSQYLAIRRTERLAEAGIGPSVGSVEDSHDNALAETVIGLFRTEAIRPRGPWRSPEAVAFATPERVDRSDNRRPLAPIGHIPPAEAEAACYDRTDVQPRPAQPIPTSLRKTRGGSKGLLIIVCLPVRRTGEPQTKDSLREQSRCLIYGTCRPRTGTLIE